MNIIEEILKNDNDSTNENVDNENIIVLNEKALLLLEIKQMCEAK